MAIRINGDNTTAAPGITSGADTDTGLQFGTDEIQLVTGGTNRATVESNGNFTIEDGNLVVASGHGIDFSATANGSGTTSTELFDDYEEGTFTPGLSFENAGTSSFSYAAQTNGHYTKVGRLVHCKLEIRLIAFSKGTGSGQLQVTGLPFLSHNSIWGQHVGNFASYGAPLPTGAGEVPIFIVYLNNTIGSLRYLRNNNAWAVFPDPDIDAQYKLDCVYTAA
jgi:hypothetical protein